MKYSQAELGRVFILRLEDGEILHEKIERFAKMQSVMAAAVIAVGGVDRGSKLVVGPELARERPVIPMEHTLDDVHEIVGTGTIFPDEKGEPVLHMHVACGREEKSVTGCVRKGVKVWHLLEIVLIELTATEARRIFDSKMGFYLLQP